MSKKIVIVWLLVMLMLFSILLMFGLKYKQIKPYIEYENNLKKQAKKYILKEGKINNNTKKSVVSTEELLEHGYIKTTQVEEKNCVGKIYVYYSDSYEYKTEIKCQ